MSFTPSQSLSKIKQYCAYQERCHSEVKTKLYSFGLTRDEVEEIVYVLITENYLNEERFAIHFAGGKFRIKKWGRNKIKQALKFKQISDYCINKALKQIEEAEYQKTFFNLADKKIDSLKTEKNIFIKKRKLRDYLIQKGFEMHLVNEVVNDI
jgi:regulatory protein